MQAPCPSSHLLCCTCTYISLSHVCAHSSNISISRVKLLNESCHPPQRFMPPISTSLVTHLNESCHNINSSSHRIENTYLCCERSGVATRRAWLCSVWGARAQRYISRHFVAVSAHKSCRVYTVFIVRFFANSVCHRHLSGSTQSPPPLPPRWRRLPHPTPCLSAWSPPPRCVSSPCSCRSCASTR